MTQHAVHPQRRFAASSVFVLITFLLLAGLAVHLNAQLATGSLTGTVTDSSGAKVAGAAVTLTNPDTGVSTKTVTTPTGAYFFEGVKAGTYSLQADQKGFKTFHANGIMIHVQQTDNLDIQFEVGDTSESVTVTTTAGVLQTEDATLGQTVNEISMEEMPLNGRNWTSLGQISAGVTTTTTNAGGGTAQSNLFSVNGVNFWQNDFRLDGIDDNAETYGGNNSENGNATIVPPPDAMQEFKLQSGDYTAEFGHSTGAVVNGVIKSGTNHLHGDLWEYVRNTDLDANEYFNKQAGNPRSAYHQNQFGGTVGGPVFLPKYDGRSKTFFFFDWQTTLIHSPLPATSSVPTALEQSSGFTNLSDMITYNNSSSTAEQTDALGRSFPQGTVFDPATTRTVAAGASDPVSGFTNTGASAVNVRDPFYSGSVMGIQDFGPYASQLNQIPGGRLDTNAVKLLGVYPAAQKAGISNNYFEDGDQDVTMNSYDVRIDENISSKDVLFGVWDQRHLTTISPETLPGVAEGQYFGSGSVPMFAYAVALGYTHVFSPTLANEFHFGFMHDVNTYSAESATTAGIPAQYGIQGIPQQPLLYGLPPINIGGLTGLGIAGWIPTGTIEKSIELSDNVIKTYGSQNLKVGYQLDILPSGGYQPTYGRGEFGYNGQYTGVPFSGSNLTSLADVLVTPEAATVANGISNVGGVSSYGGSYGNWVYDRRDYMGVYFQDDWKVNQKLTLNLGIRWDLTTPYIETSGLQANFIPGGAGDGAGGTYQLASAGCNAKMTAAFVALLAKDDINLDCAKGLKTSSNQWANYAPRVGFAYRFLPRAVVRGGYGIAYGGMANIGFGQNLGNNYPFGYTVYSAPSNSVLPVLLPNGATATMENTFSQINIGSSTSLTDPEGVTLLGRQYSDYTPYTQTWNLTVQYQLDRNDSLQVGYVGVVGRHLDNPNTTSNSASVLAPPGTNPTGYYPNPDFATNSGYETFTASSAYHSMQALYSRQLGAGLSVLANYTYSKCESDQSTQASTLSYRAQWLPGFGIKGDYSLCDTDATNVAHISGTYQLPFGKGRTFLAGANKVTDLVLGGWNLASIYTFQSGQPFTVPCASSTSAFFGCNANVVGNLYAGSHNQTQWLNPTALTTPPAVASTSAASFASLGSKPFQARGPSYTNIDASLLKDFKLTEQAKIQFRVDAFNLENTAQFNNPGNLNYNTLNNFSEITSDRGIPRELQFALKLYY